jgi:hypothetical protein
MKDKALRDEIAYEYRKWNPSASIGRALEFADSILSLLAPELEKARLWDEKCCPYGSHNLSTCWAKFGHDHYSKLPNETKCPQYTPDKVDGICTFIECSKRNADCIVNGLIKEPT